MSRTNGEDEGAWVLLEKVAVTEGGAPAPAVEEGGAPAPAPAEGGAALM